MKTLVLSGCTVLVTAISLGLSPCAMAQLNEEEFQMGRAREACSNQAKQQLLQVNRIVSTRRVDGSGGRMIGSEVILNVTRKGETYDVKCIYDNPTRKATISSLPTTPGGSPTIPASTAGSFQGRGVVHGSIFRKGQNATVALNLQTNRFNLEFTSPASGGARVVYQGTFVQPRNAPTPGVTLINGTVRSFTSPASSRPAAVMGDCRIEIFDSRVVSSVCNTAAPNSATQFLGLEQF